MCGLLYLTLPRIRNFTFPDQLGQRPQCFRSIDDNLQKIDVLITSMPRKRNIIEQHLPDAADLGELYECSATASVLAVTQ